MAEAATAMPQEGTPAPETLLDNGQDAHTDDTLLAGAEGGGDEEDKSGGEAKGTVPEAYAFDVPDTLKDIVDVDKVPELLETFGPIAKDVGLSQEQFQKLVEYDINRTMEAQKTGADGYDSRVEEWRSQAKADPHFGGAAFDRNMAIAKAGFEKVATPELRALLQKPTADNPDGLGLGNHPAFLKLMHHIGRLYAEPDLVVGRGAVGERSEEDRLRALYPTMYNKAS